MHPSTQFHIVLVSMKDYHISGVEFPSDGQTAKQHTLIVDMEKSSIFTITKGWRGCLAAFDDHLCNRRSLDSSSHAKTPIATAARLWWTKHRKAIITAFVVFLIVVILVLLALIAYHVVGS